MAVETQYNIVKVNELREVTSVTGTDELIINDVDSSPLETKKVKVEQFALDIKDYILPIATDTLLGGVKIGEGLTINPITGVLSNDVTVLNDLNDVIILSPQAGHVLRYNGVQWINEEEGGIVEIIAGDGLNGGGIEGQVVLNVNAGPGLIIEQDQVTVNVGTALEIITDKINVRVTDGLTITSNAIAPVPGVGLNVAGGAINFVPSLGLIQYGPGIRVDIGDGLALDGNKITAVPGVNLEQDINNNISVPDASYTVKGVSKFAPLLPRIEDFRGTPSYQNDSVNPELLDTLSFVPTGAVFHFASNTPPPGYLFCNGSTVSRTQYKFLFAVIGLTYNIGGETDDQFRLPDLRNEFIRGATTTELVAAPAPGVRTVGSTQDDNTRVHTHALDTEDPISGALVAPGQWAQNMMMTPTRWGFAQIGTMPIMVPMPGPNPGPDFFSDSYVQEQLSLPGLTGDRLDLETYQSQGTRDFTSDSPVEIPDGFERIEFPIVLDLDGKVTGETPTSVEPTDEDETRPRNIALLPCIKF